MSTEAPIIPQSQIQQLERVLLNASKFIFLKEYREETLQKVHDGTYNPDFLDANNSDPLQTLMGSIIDLISPRSRELQTVPSVDLDRYSGLWYEIARLPNNFENDSYNITAEYSRRGNVIEVVNTSTRKDGSKQRVVGVAKPKDDTNSRLAVTFFYPFTGDYNIVKLGQNYEYSVVASSDRKYLWVLSREPQMDEEKLREILSRQTTFDLSSLIMSKRI